jgi:hypothetical protein
MTLFDYVYPGIHSRLRDSVKNKNKKKTNKKKPVEVSPSGRNRDSLATSRRLVYTSLHRACTSLRDLLVSIISFPHVTLNPAQIRTSELLSVSVLIW